MDAGNCTSKSRHRSLASLGVSRMLAENPTDTRLRLVITAAPGGVEEVLRLIATGGDQLDLVALPDKYAVRLIGPPLLTGEALAADELRNAKSVQSSREDVSPLSSEI